MNKNISVPKYVLPAIVFSQFAGTSLWFAGNAVASDLILAYSLDSSLVAYLTSSVQFGFITGTLGFALLTIADRFSPSKVFLICALVGAFFNLGLLIENQSLYSLLGFRFATGFCLAGIYPVGMKIAADHHEKGLGKALGYLVGALVLGTALPHLIKSMTNDLPWRYVLIFTSCFSGLGGIVIWLFVPNGPFRKQSQKIKLNAFLNVFENRKFRGAAFGYFGHMWELYTFWAFVPSILIYYSNINPEGSYDISILSFIIIGIGSLSCVIGGLLSGKYGSNKVAFYSLLISGVCCLFSPLIIYFSEWTMISFLMIWGMAVISDSPQFSTLVAGSAPVELKGTALTIVNSIGFAITIVSIQITNWLMINFDSQFVFMGLLAGPILGLIAMRRL